MWWEVVQREDGVRVAFVTELAAALWARGWGVASRVWAYALARWVEGGIGEVHLWVRAVAAQQEGARGWYLRQGFSSACPSPVRRPLDVWVGAEARLYMWAALPTLQRAAYGGELAPFIQRVEMCELTTFRGVRQRRREDVEGEALFRAVHECWAGDQGALRDCVPQGADVGMVYGWVWCRRVVGGCDGEEVEEGSAAGEAVLEGGGEGDGMGVLRSPGALVREARARRAARQPRPSPILPRTVRRAGGSTAPEFAGMWEARVEGRQRVVRRVWRRELAFGDG